MNDRFKELADQARKKPMGDSWCYTDPREFEQKFAELVVRECADIATMNQYQSFTVGSYVLKHFGVEQ